LLRSVASACSTSADIGGPRDIRAVVESDNRGDDGVDVLRSTLDVWNDDVGNHFGCVEPRRHVAPDGLLHLDTAIHLLETMGKRVLDARVAHRHLGLARGAGEMVGRVVAFPTASRAEAAVGHRFVGVGVQGPSNGIPRLSVGELEALDERDGVEPRARQNTATFQEPRTLGIAGKTVVDDFTSSTLDFRVETVVVGDQLRHKHVEVGRALCQS